MGFFRDTDDEHDGIGTRVFAANSEFEAEQVIAALKAEGIAAYKQERGATQLMGVYFGGGAPHPVDVFCADEAVKQAGDILTQMGFLGDPVTSDNIRLLTHACARIELAGRTIYTDPYNLDDALCDGNLILVTHAHGDHYSPADIAKVAGEDASIVFPKSMEGETEDAGIDASHQIFLAPGESDTIEDVTITAVPAYNIGKQFHPKSNSWVGYLIAGDGETIYVAGDTDITPEAKEVICDVALVPIGGHFTMNAMEAAELVNAIGPDIAIPTHYGSVAGVKDDEKVFENAVEPQIRVEIRMEKY